MARMRAEPLPAIEPIKCPPEPLVPPIFGSAPFHAGEISLKREPQRLSAQVWFDRMSDDSFIREVNEEMRRDQARGKSVV